MGTAVGATAQKFTEDGIPLFLKSEELVAWVKQGLGELTCLA